MEITKRENIGWVDLLRVVACFLVVFSHSCDPFVGQFENDRVSFLTGVFCGSLVRCCVPLFVMMTGVLLFPVRTSMVDFYKKRIGRIFVPLVFWSVMLPVLYFSYFSFVSSGSPSVDGSTFTVGSLFHKIYTFVFNFTYDTTPLWYLYMLIGLYLFMPVISVWLQQASKRDLKLFLCVWGVSLLLPYIKMAAPMLGYAGNYGNMGLFGVCDWNEYGTLYYFSGFSGYLVLAYYLTKYPFDWSWRKAWIVTVPMFIAGYLITALGYVETQKHFPGNYAYLEIIWNFCGINVFMMTFPVFVLFRKIKMASFSWLSRVASLTFGIYLCHFIFVQVAYDLFDFGSIPAFIRILCMVCSAFIISYVLTFVMNLNRHTRRLIM